MGQYDQAEMVRAKAENHPQTVCAGGQSNAIRVRNHMEGDKPQGGYAIGPGLTIAWQDGPRGKMPDGSLAPANGAFVEDALVAAWQRLAFFQDSKFVHDDNAEAMLHIERALGAMERRAKAREARGVLGQQTV
jgi:hypothetical protein